MPLAPMNDIGGWLPIPDLLFKRLWLPPAVLSPSSAELIDRRMTVRLSTISAVMSRTAAMAGHLLYD